MKTVSFVHATSNTLRIMKQLAETELLDMECLHFLDETLMYRLPKGKGIPPEMARRFLRLVEAADSATPSLIVVTCSSYSEFIPLARRIVNSPLIAPDRETLEAAVEQFGSITLVGTLDNAVEAAERQILEFAKERNKAIKIDKVMVDGAIALLNKGASELHDNLILSAVKNKKIETEGILLCQFSIAHLQDRVSAESNRPVLSTLRTTVEKIRALTR